MISQLLCAVLVTSDHAFGLKLFSSRPDDILDFADPECRPEEEEESENINYTHQSESESGQVDANEDPNNLNDIPARSQTQQWDEEQPKPEPLILPRPSIYPLKIASYLTLPTNSRILETDSESRQIMETRLDGVQRKLNRVIQKAHDFNTKEKYNEPVTLTENMSNMKWYQLYNQKKYNKRLNQQKLYFTMREMLKIGHGPSSLFGVAEEGGESESSQTQSQTQTQSHLKHQQAWRIWAHSLLTDVLLPFFQHLPNPVIQAVSQKHNRGSPRGKYHPWETCTIALQDWNKMMGIQKSLALSATRQTSEEESEGMAESGLQSQSSSCCCVACSCNMMAMECQSQDQNPIQNQSNTPRQQSQTSNANTNTAAERRVKVHIMRYKDQRQFWNLESGKMDFVGMLVKLILKTQYNEGQDNEVNHGNKYKNHLNQDHGSQLLNRKYSENFARGGPFLSRFDKRYQLSLSNGLTFADLIGDGNHSDDVDNNDNLSVDLRRLMSSQYQSSAVDTIEIKVLARKLKKKKGLNLKNSDTSDGATSSRQTKSQCHSSVLKYKFWSDSGESGTNFDTDYHSPYYYGIARDDGINIPIESHTITPIMTTWTHNHWNRRESDIIAASQTQANGARLRQSQRFRSTNSHSNLFPDNPLLHGISNVIGVDRYSQVTVDCRNDNRGLGVNSESDNLESNVNDSEVNAESESSQLWIDIKHFRSGRTERYILI